MRNNYIETGLLEKLPNELKDEVYSFLWKIEDLKEDYQYFTETEDNIKEIRKNCKNGKLVYYKKDMLKHIKSKEELLKKIEKDHEIECENFSYIMFKIDNFLRT